mmetsp:Transcript_8783/g.15923  ORF Transcript_8783/g.15923 Transcript_8783/m.15923 type:complete len:402 (-) Transcript_8783:1956-3161(-)
MSETKDTASTTATTVLAEEGPARGSWDDDLTLGPELILSLVGIAIMAGLIVLATRKYERTRGRVVKFHYYYFGAAAATILVVHLTSSTMELLLFSPPSVALVGCVYPIYESIRAVCTPGTADDTSWLQYWVAQGVVAFSTEFIDDYTVVKNVAFRRIWYEIEFIYFLWLLLPFTDGAALTFDYVTEPLLAPRIKPLVAKMDNLIQAIISMFTNIAHLWVIWIAFVLLPSFLKRFIVIVVGTVYPLMSSVVAITTKDTGDDDTYWLTYWSCYGILFMLMDWSEAWIGWLPGFYLFILLCTVYLMLPMFQGAEKIFRHVLVPLAGLKEMLLLNDAIKVKKEMMRSVPPERLKALRAAISKSFADDGEDDEDADVAAMNALLGPSNSNNSGSGSASGGTYQSIL